MHWSHDRAVSIETEEGAVTGVRGEKDTYPAEAVVLATGGVSYPATGSTGDGYRMAAQLGHEIVPPTVHWFRWSVRTRPAGRCRGWL